MSGGPGFDDDPRGERFVRGCLAAVAGTLILLAAAGLVGLLVARCSSSPPASPGGDLEPTIAPTYSRPPSTLPAPIDGALGREWHLARLSCADLDAAVDQLAAALLRDVAEVPALDARAVASVWVSERCRGA